MTSKRGVNYMLVGAKHGVQLTVSVFSLRRVYAGPICLIIGNDEAETVAERLLAEPAAQPIQQVRWDAPVRGGKGLQHCNKTTILDHTPFDEFIFLDCDTLPTGPIDKLFPIEGTEQVVLSQFANWTSQLPKIKRRTEQYREMLPGLVAMSHGNRYPAINTGTFGMSRASTAFVSRWRELSEARPVFMCDELIAQLIFHEYPHTVLDERWNCVAADTIVQGEFAAASRSVYRGQMLEIVTRAGRRLTCTPNHPVFTTGGFVPASKLHIGQKLVAHQGEVDYTRLGVADRYHVQHRPATAEQVFQTFQARAATDPSLRKFHRPTAFDLHGDGKAVQGEIEIIWADRQLANDTITSGFQKHRDSIFRGGNEQLFPEASNSASVLGASGVPHSAPRGHRRGGQFLPFAAREQTMPRESGGAAVAKHNAARSKFGRQSSIGATDLLCQRLQTLASQVTTDEIVAIFDQTCSSGHVYDFHSRDGAIVANSIYTSNCSPIYSADRYGPEHANLDEVRIWHGHGWKFIKHPNGRAIWMPVYQDAVRENFAGLADWTPGRDKKLRRFLDQ